MNRHQNQEQLELLDPADEIQPEDYAIIIDSQGNLKTVFLPEDDTGETVPVSVQKILEIFGVLDINDIFKEQTVL